MAFDDASMRELRLDVEKLHALPSEQQEIYLLTFSNELSRHVAGLDKDGASARQSHIKHEAFKILTLTSPFPTRVIRNNLGLCLAGVLGKGNRKLLFETINELVALVSGGRTQKDTRIGHAATQCLGAVFESAGDSAISLASVACICMLKVLKAVQNKTGFRGSIYQALGKIAKGVGKSLDETLARDIWKQARQAASGDKSLWVQAQACWCLKQLFLGSAYFANSSDYDKLQSSLFKAIDSSSSSVRRAAASCLSTVLVKSYNPAHGGTLSSWRKKQKQPKKKAAGGDDDTEPPQSPVLDSQNSPISLRKLSFDITELLTQISSQYCKPGINNRARGGLALCYIFVCQKLGNATVETNYETVARHFYDEILGNPNIIYHRYRLLLSRKLVHIILGDVVGRTQLGEAGQLIASRFIVNSILRDYPEPATGRSVPTKHVLVGALHTLTGLIRYLGSASCIISDLIRDGLVQLLEHPSYTVQVHSSECLQALALVCPQQLLPIVTVCMNSVSRQLAALTSARRSPRRCLAFAFALAAVVRASSSQPLYGSIDVHSQILNQATDLLKSSGTSDLRLSSTQIQVAWVMISGLMSLGPNFVKIHLSQLLLLWRNALPRPLPKENIGAQGLLELSFLTHVRECALASIRAFTEFNARLLTNDVFIRISTMLQNTVAFLNNLPFKKTTDDVDRLLSPNLQLHHYDLMVRRRVFECYTRLATLGSQEHAEGLLQSDILSMAVTAFANPEMQSSGSLSSTIASQSGAFESIWEVGDNSGFGINGLTQGFNVPRNSHYLGTRKRHWLSNTGPEAEVDKAISSPTCDALEHDAFRLYGYAGWGEINGPDPLATEVVNNAIRTFAALLPLQSPKVQQGLLEQVSLLLAENEKQRNAMRDTAVKHNITLALLFALQSSLHSGSSAKGNLKNPTVEKTIQDLLHIMIMVLDAPLRHLAAEALGSLCKSAGNEFATKEVNYLIEVIVSNREPHVRSGCAVALGCIHTELGGMAAGLHLKTIFGLLASLASDSHPMVHFWALDSIAKVADAAGLTFATYVPGALGLLAQLYMQDSHNEQADPLGSSNLEIDYPATTVIARCVGSVINVLGPDLQDATKTRNLIMTLAQEFQNERNPLVTIATLQSLEHLSLYAPGHISFTPYIRQLQQDITSENRDVQVTAMSGLHNAMRRNVNEVFQAAGSNFEDQLWTILNNAYGHGLAKNLIKTWIQQTAMDSIDSWIKRCHSILTKQVDAPKHEQKPNVDQSLPEQEEPNLQDEEVAGFAASAAGGKDEVAKAPESTSEFLRWQVRSVAMECLNDILNMVVQDSHIQENSSAANALQPRISDLIRIAFTASTASVVELRIQGIQIIRQVLLIFGKTPDPEFLEVPLLEQYQAQISSALTPAFAGDSSPVLAAESIGVCAAFIATGIVTNIDRMGRIFKLLVSALNDFSKDSETAAIGDLQGLSSNAKVMVRLAVYSAWAEIQIASGAQKYLIDVVEPYLRQLAPVWLESLKEYARLKFEPDISATAASSPLADGIDMVYAALSRETLLQFYQASWLHIVNAIASLIDEGNNLVFDVLDDQDGPNGHNKIQGDINYRHEPAAFFFVLFGIAFEALVSSSHSDSGSQQARMVSILQAIKQILRPSIAGLAIYQDAIFSEMMDLLDRLVLTEGLEVQIVIVEIARNLCIEHPSARRSNEDEQADATLADDIDQLFELTRIIVLVIARLVPSLSENSPYAQRQLTEEMVPLAILALTALADAAEAFPSIIKGDLHACTLHIFATILSTGNCQEAIVPQALPIFRRFISSTTSSGHPNTPHQIRHTLARFLVILRHAQKRESEAALACEKNTILATTLLITSVTKVLTPNDPLVMRFLEALIDCLGNSMTSKIAANCARSLLLIQTAGLTESAIAAFILPRLIDFIGNPSDVEGTETARPLVAKALVAFVVHLPQAARPAAVSLLLPAILQRASVEGKVIYQETASRLLDLATADQVAFKAVMAQMEGEQRAFTEGVLRSAAGRHGRQGSINGIEDKEPTIALRMDFGS